MTLIPAKQLASSELTKELHGGPYIDKTQLIQKLIETEPPHLLMTRPEGFGKTVLIKTLKEMLSNYDAFKGCHITADHSKFNWEKHKVIEFDFNLVPCDTAEAFESGLKGYIEELCKMHSVEFKRGSMQCGLVGLVEALGKGQQLAMLIDNYDTPVTKSWHDYDLAEPLCRCIASFLTTLKSLSGALNFTFVTGKVCLGINSMWSGPNHLHNITLDAEYAHIMGYTLGEAKELIKNSKTDPAKLAQLDMMEDGGLEDLQQSCGVYCLSNCPDPVFRPSSVAKFINGHEESEQVPQFLVNLFRQSPNTAVCIEHLKSFPYDLAREVRTNKPDLTTLLFQMGYLTIDAKSVGTGICDLVFPSKAVRAIVFGAIIRELTQVDIDQAVAIGNQATQALEDADINTFIQQMNLLLEKVDGRLFSEIGAYSLYVVCVATLALGGVDVTPKSVETESVDLIVRILEKVCLLGLKLDKNISTTSNSHAVDSYQESDTHVGCSLMLNFSSTLRAITSWKVVDMDGSA